jgi:hypothetical protein
MGSFAAAGFDDGEDEAEAVSDEPFSHGQGGHAPMGPIQPAAR